LQYVFSQCHHMSIMNFVVSPRGCGRSVTDFWGLDAHEAQLRCPDDYEVPGWALNLSSIKLPYHGHHGNLPLQGKIPLAEPGIEPGGEKTWPLDHEAGRIIAIQLRSLHMKAYVRFFLPATNFQKQCCATLSVFI
jgi:hypothetical protein